MISLILYGRNDSYGYNLHKRAAISLNCMAEMLDSPDDEILFVDYNTPDDFPTFPEAIQDTLTDRAKKLLRILRVRSSQHEQFRALTGLVALEPISRNVAVRRSNPANRWILSTNTDMVFVPRRGSSLSEVASNLPDSYYHLPRFEVPETLWESADRLDPAGTIAAFGSWGTQFHLNEIVFSQDPAVRYDAPGDFQLILRSDLWRIHGFHEEMLLGWHVDSNMAKRLALIPYKIGDILDDFYGYHCDHTRQVTPMHRSQATENSLQVFFEDVVQPEVPGQAQTWGLAGEQIEELRIGSTSRVYLNALKLVPSAPLVEPRVLHYSGESFNGVDYTVEHLIPFLADIFASYPRTTVVGWVGSKKILLERFALVWKGMGFTEPITVLETATWLGNELPGGCVWAKEALFAEAGDVYVFDWGKPDGILQDDWRLGSDPATSGVTRSFRRMVKAERLRISDRSERPRRFVGVNAINNNIERIIADNVGVTRSPLATRIRQGFVTEYRETRDLMPHLIVGRAARLRSGRIVTLPGDAGFIFFGPYIDLESAVYRLTIELEYESPPDSSGLDSGVSLEIVSGPWLLGHETLSADELRVGTIQREFRISTADNEAAPWTRIETRLRTMGRSNLSVLRVYLQETSLFATGSHENAAPLIGAASNNVGVDYVPLLHLGPAGVSGESARGDGAYVIHANPGVANYICYGPYYWLRAGRYAASFEFMVHAAAPGATISMYVVSNLGRRLLGKGFFEPDKRGFATHTVIFEVGEEMPLPQDGLMEFLVWSGGEIVYSLNSLHLTEVHEVAASSVLAAKPAGDLLSALVTTDAGTKLPDGIITLTRTSGVVFSSPRLDFAPGLYRLSMRIDRASFQPTPANESGLGLEIVVGSSLSAFREITRGECERGEVSIEFGISSSGPGDDSKVEFRLRTTGLAEAVVSSLDVEKLNEARAVESFTDFDAMLLLNAGIAGDRVLAPIPPSKMAIRAKRGIEGNVSHGPYVWLPEGEYEAVFEFAIERGIVPARIAADVVTNLGIHVLSEAIFVQKRRGLLRRMLGRRWGRLEGVLAFEVPAAVPEGDNGQIEFRTWSSGRSEFFLLALHVRKKQIAPAKDL